MLLWELLHLIILVVLQLETVVSQPCMVVPKGISTLSYSRDGDIILGMITSGRDFGTTDEPCKDTLSVPFFGQGSVAFVYEIDKVNKDSTILPNITLGFTILDDCLHPQTGLVRALSFIPPGMCGAEFPHHRVVAALGYSISSSAVVYGQAMNLFQIPTIQTLSTNARLSNREVYKYMVRIVSSDIYQAQAIISILLKFNWTYISTISSSGDYGRDGIREIHQLADIHDICVAYTKETSPDTTEEDYDEIVRALVRHKKARVIVMFLNSGAEARLMAKMQISGLGGHFIIIGSDAVDEGHDPESLQKVFSGALVLSPYVVPDVSYETYYNELTPSDSDDPWLKLLWSKFNKCLWNSNTTLGEEQCQTDVQIKDTPLKDQTSGARLVIDGVKVIVQVLDEFLKWRCPEAFQDKGALDVCLRDKEEILRFLHNAKLQNADGQVTGFDKNGDADGKYKISQVIWEDGKMYKRPVGIWDKQTFSLSLQDELYWQESQLVSSIQGVPESVCAKPCKPGEFLIRQDLKCCWECERCRDNEVVTEDGLSCRECPLFMWPDQIGFENCTLIQPSFMEITSPLTLLCAISSCVGLFISAIVLILMVLHKKEKLIKATSLELSIISLFGVILSFLTAFILIVKPSDALCYIKRFGFNLSFAFSYAPLFTKVTRIYRIFSAGERGVINVSFIGNRSQIILTTLLISIQVVLTIISVYMDPPKVEFRMPSPLEKFVEMLCHYPLSAILFSLTYNLLLMVACTCLAFKARKLPENFNESRYIFVCVCTTLFLWIAFLPTYFTAFYASHKILLLVCLLVMNSVVFLLCLYFPRLYAIIFVSTVDQGLMSTGTKITQVDPGRVSSVA